MNKLSILLVIFLTFGTLNGQVGIQTQTPKATLDVNGKPADTGAVDGIIPPRLTGDQLQSKTGYDLDQNGSLVYVTAATTSPSNQTINVTQTGLYYYDAEQKKWVGFSQWSSRSIYRTLPNAVPSGTPLPSNGLITLDSKLRVGLKTNSTGRYYPYLENISGGDLEITFASITAGQTIQKKNGVLKTISNGELLGVENDNELYGSQTRTETLVTNVIFDGSWYEVKWFSYTDYATNPIRHFYMSSQRIN